MKASLIPVVLFLCLLSWINPNQAHAQSESHNFITYDTTISLGYGPSGGFVWLARITRPANMFTANHPDTASRPAIIHQSGAGEIGMNYGLLQVYGPHYWLNHGWDGGVQLGNGTHYPIIISIQPGYQFPQSTEVAAVLTRLLNKFHIKRNSVHVDGLSQGGFMWTSVINYQSSAGDETGMKMITSIVALQGVANEVPPSGVAYDATGWSQFARWATKYNGKFFGLEGTNDGRDVWRAAYPMNVAKPNSAYYSMENIGGGNHCCWNDMFDPSRTNWQNTAPMAPNIANNTYYPNAPGNYKGPSSIFQWMLRQGDTTMVGSSVPQPPTVSAGSDQSLILPIALTTLSGTATPASGSTITGYEWSKVSGGPALIVSLSSQVTLVTGLSLGNYIFRLTATSSNGTTASDDVTVNVNPLINQAPTANAGGNQSITLPLSGVTLSGTGTDPDGSIASYQWTKISGPTQFTIVSPTAAETVINNLVQGTYQFELKVTDNSGATATSNATVVVNAAANQAPTAIAGGNQNITLPVSTVTLSGSGTDADGTIASYQWTRISGPTQFTIVSPAAAQTVINNLAQGTYQFQLKVTDNAGATATSTASVVVNAAANQAPVAIAGTNQSITLPVSTVTLTGSGTDADGTIASYQWTKLSGPTQFTIVSPAQATTVINNLAQGVYQFELKVTDNAGATANATVSITVNSAANQTPVAIAGTNQSITLPISTVTLTGSGTDADGTIASYQWTKISGPTQFTIVSPAQATTVINNLAQGVYVFELKVTDNAGATANETVTITVNGAANQTPVAIAGSNQAITLPVSTVTLTGSGTDADGTIASYQWTKISGPTPFTIVSPALATTVINSLAQGVYVFELKVTDNDGATATATTTVTVNTAANQTPTAVAGSNQAITLPLSGVTLTGSGADADGTIASYQWTKISGPAQFAIVSPTQASTLINNLVQGVYVFELKVTDNAGATATDNVTVTVNAAANQAPTATAGSNQAITLPLSGVTVAGSGTDADGSIASYQWTKLSGPAQFNIVSPAQASTLINNLVQGVYVFELKVTDNAGATATATVTITVNAAAIPPPPPPPPAGGRRVVKVAPSEYKVGYLDNYGDFYSFSSGNNNAMTRYNVGARKIVDVCEGFNVLQMLDDQGYVWQGTGSPNPVRWETDTTGAPFNNNVAIFGWWSNYISIRSDSSLWYWGEDKYNLYPGNARINQPIQLSPAGMKVKKVVMGSRIVVLTTNGQVWEWTPNGPLTPVQKSIPRPAIDIFASSYSVQGCLIPDATGPQNMGYPYVWGVEYAFWGGSSILNEPTSMKALWNLSVPVKEIAANSNIIHWIDSQDRLWGLGDNPDGELGNNTEIVNKYTYNTQYAWSWNKGEAYTGPIPTQIGAGIQWKKLFKGNTIAYYSYALDANDSLYFWGRDKALNSGRGWLNWQESSVPNVMDVLTPTMVSPLSAIWQAYDWHIGTVDAGTDQSVTATTATLSGSAVAPYLSARGPVKNGKANITWPITGYQWTKISGPGGAITTPTSATTTITGLTTGTYTFRLVATDANTGTRMDDVQIVVNAGNNQAPIAIAGNDQTITLPLSGVTVNGAGTDADGSIASYQWSQVSGPTQFTIASPSQATTIINNLVQGVYKFELKVTDNLGAIATSIITITVNAAPAANQAPFANAGLNQTIALPLSGVSVSGSGNDADGTITGYQWTKISGPAQFTIVSPNQAQTLINNLVAGIYQFQLKVTDDDGATAVSVITIIVNNAANQAPVANAGNNQTITLPLSGVTLTGSGTDADGTISSYQWTKISGPGQYTIVSSAQAQTLVNNLAQGVYQFELKVTDNNGATGLSTVTVTVNAGATPPSNQSPIVTVGSNQAITLPTNSVTVNGDATDADGTIASYSWSQISGPAQFTIVSPGQKQTAINNLVAGVYRFELTATDNQGATGTATLIITVDAAPNLKPAANAGVNQIIFLPLNSVILYGSGTDPDGTIASYQWTKISGPGQFTFASPTQAQTTANNLVQGIYVFELTVTDNQGATATSFATITVNAAAPPVNQPPVADAGADQTITLPVNKVTVNGSGTDPDGIIVSYSWSMISGPAQYTIVSPNKAQTEFKDLVNGVYLFELLITDNGGATATAIVQITVKGSINRAPLVNAGADQKITMPVTEAQLSGTASDPDGLIAKYSWKMIDGPGQPTIVSASSIQSLVKDLEQGIYKFELTVTDNSGATASDIVEIEVIGVQSKVALYPNPATTQITIQINAATQRNKSVVWIFDARGTLVYTTEFMRDQVTMTKTIDVSNYASGVYFVKIGADINHAKTIKFVKQ